MSDSKYLERLTNDIIRRNNFDLMVERRRNSSSDTWEIIDDIKIDLVVGDVSKMNPYTLGGIMCSFEIGDVFLSKAELFESIEFSGDFKELLREQVALGLAHVIFSRTDPEIGSRLPKYTRRRK